MRGKYITTLLKLAVLAGNKRNKPAEETPAAIEDYKTIWTKELFGAKQGLINSTITSKLKIAEVI